MRFALVLCGLAAALTPALALAANRTATSRAKILRPIALLGMRDLDFGRVIAGATAGTAIINARTDARTRSGGVTLAGGGSSGAARFTCTGTVNAQARITVGALPNLVRSGGSETMAVSALTLNGGRNRRFSATGALDIRVGGTLRVAANQVAGSYLGTFTVTVDYL